MKKLIVLLLCVAVFTGCTKEYHCKHDSFKIPLYLCFAGYQPAELDTIVVDYYVPNGHYDSLASTKVYTDTAYKYIGDTAMYYIVAGEGANCIVRIPATGNIYKISDVFYPAPDLYYTRKTPCGGGIYWITASTAVVNGQTVNTIPIDIQPALCLAK